MTGSTYIHIAETKLKHPDRIVFLDSCADVPYVLRTGCVDILKINYEESISILQDIKDFEKLQLDTPSLPIINSNSILEIGESILENYKKLQIMAITNGSESSFLFHRLQGTIKILEFIIPPISDFHDIYLDQLGSSDDEESIYGPSAPFCRSLPSPTMSSKNLFDSKKHQLRLNPLGAGDTCSAVFLITYLETRDIQESFKQGLAAASASCFELESSGHYNKYVMERIHEKIQCQIIK
jgi:hypothetical protein